MQSIDAIVLDSSGATIFGTVQLPDKISGKGEVEVRSPGDFGDFHTSPEGKSVVIAVSGTGTWCVELASGTRRNFTAGAVVAVQDFGALTIDGNAGHRSRNSGTQAIMLTKVVFDSQLDVVM